MWTNVENTFTFIFPYLFNVFFSYPKRYLLVSKNQHWRSQFSKRNVCLSFTAFEERRGFDHSRVQFDDIVFSSAVKYSNSGSKRFRNMVYKYRNVGQLVALESKKKIKPWIRPCTRRLDFNRFSFIAKFSGLVFYLSVKYTLFVCGLLKFWAILCHQLSLLQELIMRKPCT